MPQEKSKVIAQYGRCKWVDNARGVAIIFVVLGHVITNGMTAGILDTNVFSIAEKMIYSFHMPLFFFCSGYLLSPKNDENINGVVYYYTKRIIGLLIPYIIFSLIYLSFKCLFGGSSDVVANKVTWGDAFSIYSTPIGEYWFLYTLVLLTIVFFVVLLTSRFFRKELRDYYIIAVQILLFIAGIYCLYSRAAIMESGLFFGIKRSLFYLSYFTAGYLIRRAGNYENIIKSNWTLGISSILSVTFMVLRLTGYSDSILLRILLAFSLIVFVTSISGICLNLFSMVGQKTMPIYLFHVYIIVAFKYSIGGIVTQWIYVPVVTFLAILVPLWINKVIEKYKILDFWLSPNKYLFKI